MARVRAIQAAEASLWLEVLLTYAFGPAPAQQAAQLDLVGIAHDATAYPDDIPNGRLAQLLLAWAERYVEAGDWQRLQARIRQRRSQSG
ncbi:hypothetical protein [Halomonas alkaliantarctica]|uniref:hypothetical protein n=1 Tax=Halomonas alkaliantarctica TaxID=232346 RepID=UPI0004AB925C|nr:hypothetical protein [Halomonas alkaliantarctica]